MSQPSQPAPPEPARPGPRGPQELSARFATIVGILGLMIVALLAGLWLRERVRAVRAEAGFQQLSEETRRLQALVGQLILSKALPARVSREDLPTTTVRLNGREVKALRLSAELAETLGFQGGDVILVQPPPAPTSSATAPSAPTPAHEGPEPQ